MKIKLLLMIGLIVLLSSCKVVAEPETVSQPQTTTTVTTTIPTTTLNNETISAQLATLTKEDGTGEIHLQMTVEEIATVLDKYDIKHTLDETGLSVRTSYPGNIWLYCENFYAGYGQFTLNQSYSGLKVGDSKDKLLDMYGEPDETYDKYGTIGYVYHTGVATDIFSSPINFTVQMEDDIVTHIFVCIDVPYDKLYD